MNGKEYSGEYNSYASFKEDGKFRMFYNPDNPYEWISWIDIKDQEDLLSDDVKGFRMVGIGYVIVALIVTAVSIVNYRKSEK